MTKLNRKPMEVDKRVKSMGPRARYRDNEYNAAAKSITNLASRDCGENPGMPAI